MCIFAGSSVGLDTVIAAAALAFIITYSGLFSVLHRYRLFRCPLCLGFHTGWIFAWFSIGDPMYAGVGFWSWLFILLRAAAISSVLSMLISSVITGGDDET